MVRKLDALHMTKDGLSVDRLAAPADGLVPSPTSQTPASQSVLNSADLDPDTELWNAVEGGGEPDDYGVYIKQYPKGKYIELANRRLIAIKVENADIPRVRQTIKDCSDCPEMVLLPAGSFIMGSYKFASESPRHMVTIPRSFYMGKYAVTQGEWKAVIGSNASKFQQCGDNCPAEQVSWNDAQDFIQKLNAKTGKNYRLPNESEWEYACRAGASHEYCGSDDVESVGWHFKNSGDTTHPVGGKQPNAWGLYDMSGNVWEWVKDWYHKNYDGAPSDGSAWESGGDQRYRVLRGGAWVVEQGGLRSTNRGGGTPDERNGGSGGFRLVRTEESGVKYSPVLDIYRERKSALEIALVDRVRQHQREAEMERKRNAISSRFAEQSAGVLKDSQTNLEWTQSDNGSNISWDGARNWCNQKGGNWSLPTVAQLQSIFDSTHSVSTRCARTTCFLPQKFELTNEWFWSSELSSTSEAWLVSLSIGEIFPLSVGYATTTGRALCVRRF